jgi:hypothetical protein
MGTAREIIVPNEAMLVQWRIAGGFTDRLIADASR